MKGGLNIAKKKVNHVGIGVVNCTKCGVKKKGDEKYWKVIKSSIYCPKCTFKKGYDPERPGLHKLKGSNVLDKWK